MDQTLGRRIVALQKRIVADFKAGDWEAVGLLTGKSEPIERHPRLMRSLSWGDDDYDRNVLSVLRSLAADDIKTLTTIERYLDEHYPGDSEYVSSKPSGRKITFAPNVFTIPDESVEADLVALMIPLRAEFDPVHKAIRRACRANRMRCLRANDIWSESVIVQDIFNLVFRSQVVVVDFTGKNPNVMYETGIAHTLGKSVVPISQAIEDVPFDLAHHRVLNYLSNSEGLATLEQKLTARLEQFKPQSTDDDDIPW